jgi:type I restriction-modification system DNA methylase subunit
MISKEEAYKIIQQLVIRFGEQIDSYKSGDYNETLTRRDFIDPLFKALGWDVDNSQGYAEAYREVIHEDRVKVGKATKAPDYSFRLGGGKRLFFVEAKKPSVDIKGDVSVAYQIRRYGWSAKLPISIITDFEEFSVYDCTKKPNPTDKSSIARIKYLTYDKYLDEFEYLWDTFSKERVLKGSFDRYVQSDTVRKGTATVDKEFLISLDTWRTYLATSISIKNKQLDEDEINFAVQQTIDRLIFLRIAEDRGVEPYGQLKLSVNAKGDSYQNLFHNFKKADEKYNSGLFDFKKDVISESLTIDSKVVKTIIGEMYYPESPYEFSVLSVEILGSAYEQFLGKQIKIDTGHRAKIEEKPEVRKAGGVYYTPQYVVDYIVENTVGKLIEGKTPKQIEKIKIADPACGSGSFLIGAYQFLLDFHKNYYTENGTKTGKKDSPTTPEGNLTSSEKKRILLNNIFGVDIDVNAVEVTKLSLLLKCLEGETETSIAQQYKLWHDRILPTLDNNIKSGNSLVDIDFYDSVIDFGEEKKIKPFNWQRAFPEVYNQGGFDFIIGNPPYVRSQHLDDSTKKYLTTSFSSASYQPDLFAFFIEKGIKLLKPQGKLGFIIPNGILTNSYYAKSRLNILRQTCIEIIVDLKDKVFEGASVDTSIFILKSETDEIKRNTNKAFIGEHPAKTTLSVVTPNSFIVQQDLFNNSDYVFNSNVGTDDLELIKKIKTNSTRLGDLCLVKNGMKVRKEFVSNKQEDNRYKKFLLGASVKPFLIDYKGKWVCYDKSLEQEFSNQAFREEELFKAPSKILIRQVMGKDSIFATLDNQSFYIDQSIYILLPKKESINLPFILGLLNSKLLYFFFSKTFSDRKETFPKIKGVQLAEFPVRETSNDNISQTEIAKAVDSLIKLNEELRSAKLPDKIEQLKIRIDHIDKRINILVYELYKITKDEIAIIESC